VVAAMVRSQPGRSSLLLRAKTGSMVVIVTPTPFALSRHRNLAGLHAMIYNECIEYILMM
jgi:hypothetical protein